MCDDYKVLKKISWKSSQTQPLDFFVNMNSILVPTEENGM